MTDFFIGGLAVVALLGVLDESPLVARVLRDRVILTPSGVKFSGLHCHYNKPGATLISITTFTSTLEIPQDPLPCWSEKDRLGIVYRWPLD